MSKVSSDPVPGAVTLCQALSKKDIAESNACVHCEIGRLSFASCYAASGRSPLIPHNSLLSASSSLMFRLNFTH